jgi:hypothetical protein
LAVKAAEPIELVDVALGDVTEVQGKGHDSLHSFEHSETPVTTKVTGASV